ncbi:MAG: hypothetical protein M1840_005751 [Geoglossum simile]|nr:MAG: hypothetical protein M1840_005751 [Geoglossum simile]
MPPPTKTTEKKLTQNRASKKFRREEKESYVRYLEERIHLLEEQLDARAEPTDIIYRQLKLMEENQELREALLGMRKKFESFSNQAKSIADDPTAMKILNENKVGSQNSQSTGTPTSTSLHLEPHPSACPTSDWEEWVDSFPISIGSVTDQWWLGGETGHEEVGLGVQ